MDVVDTKLPPNPTLEVDSPILRVEGLAKDFVTRTKLFPGDRFGGPTRTRALADVSLSLRRGDTLGIVGESGSGKTTLARTIVRLIKPDAGTVEFEGRDLLRLTGRELAHARRKIQMVYQNPYSSLNPALTIKQAIAEPIRVHRLSPRDGVPTRVAELMTQVGLDPRLAERRPRELSGGQRQRVAIARALAAEPEILIADEAVSALDVSIQAQVLSLFRELQAGLGLTMIFVSHQLAVVAQVCERVAIMYRGRIVESGPTREVFETPRHGYSVALLRAHPGRRQRTDRSPSGPIRSDDAPPLDQPGCPFRHKCAFAVEECRTVTPQAVRVSNSRFAECLVLPYMSRDEVHNHLEH